MNFPEQDALIVNVGFDNALDEWFEFFEILLIEITLLRRLCPAAVVESFNRLSGFCKEDAFIAVAAVEENKAWFDIVFGGNHQELFDVLKAYYRIDPRDWQASAKE